MERAFNEFNVASNLLSDREAKRVGRIEKNHIFAANGQTGGGDNSLVSEGSRAIKSVF